MRARTLRGARRVAAAAAVGLVLLGCGTGTGGADAGPTTRHTTSPGTEVTPSSAPSSPGTVPVTTETDPAAEPRGTYVPPELVGLPPEDEIDQMMLDAEAAYRAYLVAYDDAARSGFTDAALVDVVVAGAAEETLDSLQREIEAAKGDWYLMDGGFRVVGLEPVWIRPPEPDGAGLSVALDVCLAFHGTVGDGDGGVWTVGYEEPMHVRTRLVDHDGTWIVVEQKKQDGPCPDGLVGSSSR